MVPISASGRHGAITCSSSTLSAMLASSGDKMPPCGVPVSDSSKLPVSVMIPAFKKAFTNATTRLSFTLARTRSIKAVWSIMSKHASMSASSTQ